MIGAILGDIIGSRFEFNNTNRTDFELFTARNNYTDDTICTLAIADAITRGENYRDTLVKWCHKYPNPMGAYGGGFQQWIFSKEHKPYNSYGNGSAMRVSAIGWAFQSLEQTLEEAKKSAECSHNHPEGIKGAQAVAHAIWRIRQVKPEERLAALSNVADIYYPVWRVRTVERGVWCDNCQGCVPLCFNIAYHSTSFEDAIRKAISWGGDSDTVGAITGSLAEAIWGVPAQIYDRAFDYLDDRMCNTIADFYQKLTH